MSDKFKSNYAIQVESARADFVRWDRGKMNVRLVAAQDEQFWFMRFFGTTFSVSKTTGEVLHCSTGEAAGFSATMTIYDVLCYAKPGAAICGEWQTLTKLSPQSHFGSASSNSFFKRVANSFSGNIELLKQACVKMGGLETTKADVGFMFQVFPFLPVIFQFWDGDEEFKPRVNFLFDKNTLDFIHFETAWYVAGHLVDSLKGEL